MDKILYTRRDLMSVFNNARFILRHFAMGYYKTTESSIRSMPVNRMFFPLENPGGAANYLRTAEKTLPLIPGKMYFIPACYPADMHLNPDIRFLSVQANLEIFPGADLFSGCQQILEIDSGNEAEVLSRIFYTPQKNLYSAAVTLGGRVLNILARLQEYFPEEDFWNILALREYNDLAEYLLLHGTAATKVRDLAAARNESREHFTRHFSARTGMSPKALIDRVVTGKCLSLISEGYSFKEIAQLLDFSDEYVFSRFFKRNIGVSPRVWRDKQNLCNLPEKYS